MSKKNNISNHKPYSLLPAPYSLFICSLLIVLCSLLICFSSCKNDLPQPPNYTISWNIPEDGYFIEYDLHTVHVFKAQNIINNSFYDVHAELLAKNELCNIWVEKSGDNFSVTKKRAEEIAEGYKNLIYHKLDEIFGADFELYNGKTYRTMQIADFMGNQDGKLCILLLDIIDGYTEGGPYVAGYFSHVNFYDSYPGVPTNKRDMIYIDTFPGDSRSENVIRIIAHELQHLMNFITREIRGLPQMDIWINEGLSSAAEWAVLGHSINRIEDYNNNRGGSIAAGNNFFVWDNHRHNPTAILDDYSTVYLFFQWLRLQNDIDIYSSIISSIYPDYRAVTESAAGYSVNDWERLLKDWLTANYLNLPEGLHGYKNDFNFIGLSKHLIRSSNIIVSLFPGEGIYSYSPDNNIFPVSSGNIRYVRLYNALLTFNANVSNRGRSEVGTITGILPPIGPVFNSSARTIFEFPSGSYPVSIDEMLRRREMRLAQLIIEN